MNEFIDKFYPYFKQWVKQTKGYATVDGIDQIKLWHEFLETLKGHVKC